MTLPDAGAAATAARPPAVVPDGDATDAAGAPLRPIVSRDYTGRWVAWTPDGLRIVAAAATPDEVRAAAARLGHERIVYEWVPPLATQLAVAGP